MNSSILAPRRRKFSVFRAYKMIFPLFLMISLRKSSKMLIFSRRPKKLKITKYYLLAIAIFAECRTIEQVIENL